MKDSLGEDLTINWRYFSLEQVNSKEGPEWKVWEQPEDYASRGLGAFRAAEAARRQGEAAFDSFHMALVKARHEEHQDIADKNILTEVAKSAGLDMDQFQKDTGDRSLLDKLAEDHTHAVDTLGVFGTPTLVFPENQAVFLKMILPPAEDSLSIFSRVRYTAEEQRYIWEIKRPVPPK